MTIPSSNGSHGTISTLQEDLDNLRVHGPERERERERLESMPRLFTT